MAKTKQAQADIIYQIKVTLQDSRPPIWRRILVSGDTTLGRLHWILQVVMGWTDSHLHLFDVNGRLYSSPEINEMDEPRMSNENRARLRDFIPGEGFKFEYEYDFGDSWRHTLLVEKVLAPEPGQHYPVCIKGKRACPPEDVGSMPGYEYFLEAYLDPKHKEYAEYREWIGEEYEFDPEHFDLEEVNQALDNLPPEKKTKGKSQPAPSFEWAFDGDDEEFDEDEPELSAEEMERVDQELQKWLAELPQEFWNICEQNDLRQDLVTLLEYINDRRPKVSASTGNLSLKVVKELNAAFQTGVNLEKLPAKVRSEEDVSAVLLLHDMALALQLIQEGQGQRLERTPVGEVFDQLPAPMQIWMIFGGFWLVDWNIHLPLPDVEDLLPDNFLSTTVHALLAIPAGGEVEFKSFTRALWQQFGHAALPEDAGDDANIIAFLTIQHLLLLPLGMLSIIDGMMELFESEDITMPLFSTIEVTPFGRNFLTFVDGMFRLTE